MRRRPRRQFDLRWDEEVFSISDRVTRKDGKATVSRDIIADAVEYVNWVDLIVPIGGDGTFLLTSKLITNNVKPMIGINPNQEEYGNLTLPYKYSSDIATIFEMLLGGEYTILMRSLIRTSMHGEEDYIVDPFTYNETDSNIADGLQRRIRVLPWLALNEVFMGEFMAARTSTMSFQADGKTECKIRSSGKDTICSFVSFATGKDFDDANIDDVQAIRSNITFNPVRIMRYRLKVKFRGLNAGSILDGSISLAFNDITTTVFEIHPGYAFKTIQLNGQSPSVRLNSREQARSPVSLPGFPLPP
ncbi:hypothetical protein PV328_001827 [Microctonus aethiopoides]|uniref:NAD(+) kinase n=1 Tax=Microctonus aethiopoides TaxID=144406 RepID=A0AA39KXR6_9HYME|nr:hypothetical protein PV328_001827 [Microctonus aethiopoides]